MSTRPPIAACPAPGPSQNVDQGKRFHPRQLDNNDEVVTLSNKVDREKINACLEDGLLTLTLPKAKHPQPRKIAIG